MTEESITRKNIGEVRLFSVSGFFKPYTITQKLKREEKLKNRFFCSGIFLFVVMFLLINSSNGATTSQVKAGYAHSVSLRTDGTVWVCGANHNGELGLGDTVSRSYSVQVSGLSGVTAIAAGGNYTVALKSDGTVWTTGHNYHGQLGVGDTSIRYSPVQVSGLSGVTAIAAGSYHTLALKSDGTVWAWGGNWNGQLGVGDTSNRYSPVQVSGLSGVTAIAAGGYHTVALKSGGTLWAWGYNGCGQLGNSTFTNSTTPVQAGISNVTAIAAGENHTVALDTSGYALVCGYDGSGQLGFYPQYCWWVSSGWSGYTQCNSRYNWNYFSTLMGGVTAIACGYQHTIFLKSDGTVWTTGYNYYGQLGVGDTSIRYSPVQVSGLGGVTAIAGGGYHTLALKSDGMMWAWGANWYGQLGDGTTTNRNTPVQVIVPDTTPDQFTFTDQTGVALNTVITSNAITVSGINTAAGVSITGGEYAVNSGTYTSASGTVNNGNTVTVRQTSSASYTTTTNATLTIGGVSDTFSVTTQSRINSAPVANAGADQSVDVGSTVTLDGSASSDPDIIYGDAITYSWTMSSTPTGSTATLTSATSVNPTFTADKSGTYIVSLTVSDGTLNSTDTVSITTVNSAPSANAGAGQSVNVGSTVTLDGSGSSDPDGDAITYSWSISSIPTNSTATLTNPTSANPTFVADKAGTYMVSLTVSDNGGLTNTATVTITTINRAPVANAGAAPLVYVGGTVALDGSGSSDPDGDAITYSWSMNSKPTDSAATLTNPTTANPTFTADKAGTYEVSLTVSDGGLSDTATVSVTTSNSGPVASAGPAQTVYVGNTVTLDGSGSYDADGNLLTFNWAFTTVPTGSGAALSVTTSVNPTFTVDKAGTYVVSLTVNDGTTGSAASTVTISTTNSAPVADAGADQSPYVGNTVTLNGNGSHDVDGDLLTYSWSFTSTPADSAATLTNPSSLNPTFTVDKAGTYIVSLTVNDGTTDSAASTVTISTTNSAPVAKAGDDQSPYVDNTVTLDGSGSHDVDGNQLTYRWAFTTMPTGSNAMLSDVTAVKPTFTVDRSGTYVVSLIVNDGTVDSAVDTITISTLNSAPVAEAGTDQSPYVDNTVTLDGSGSIDVDGNQLTYKWAFTTMPTGSGSTLSDATAVNPTFTVDKSGTYVVSLMVNDGNLDSAVDTVTISTSNSAPVADAGADQSPYVNDTVTLDGSGSTDVDGNQLTYKWAFTSRPADSSAALSDTTAVNPTFTVDKSGTYVVSLTVNDGTVDSAVDTVTISTLNSAPVANAGADQSPYVNDTVTLDGSGSHDVDGNQLTYRWAFTSRPTDSNAALSDTAAVNPTFTVDKSGTYVVSLTVNDGTVDSAADTITINTTNSAPVASAGADQSPYVNDMVTLDGSGSTDVDGNQLTYKWAFTSVPSGSSAALSDTTAVNPTFTVDRAGTYVVSLTVNDGTVDSAADTVTINTSNSAPVANAGADKSAYVNDTVTLDGSGSTDVDGNLLTYHWAFTTTPTGSSAALSDATAVNPTFTVDKAGTYVVSLTVNDGTVNSAADTVTITTLNSAPVAYAGTDQSVYVGSTVTLDGSGSSDVDGNSLTYSWAFTAIPTGSSATLSNTGAVNPTFDVDKAGTYVVSLVVNDGTVNSAADTVTISTINVAPVSDAGDDQSVSLGYAVTLDGSGSTDADGNTLTYTWAFTTKPSGSSAGLNDPASVNPTFTPDVEGTYVVSLIVNDGTVNGAPDTVTITVKIVEAEVTIKPETINLKEKGKFKAFIELPSPYSGSDVVVSSVECQGAHAIQGRVDDEGRFIATFNVRDLNIETHAKKEEATLVVSGELKDGAKFQGSDTVKVKSKGKEKEKGKDKDK